MRSLIVWTFLSISYNLYGIDELTIDSKVLGYKIKFWVYYPKSEKPVPVLFVTDGDGYKRNGIVDVSKNLVSQKKVTSHAIVMVSAVNPDNPDENRRNSQFLCNPKYLRFYIDELIPFIDKEYATIKSPDSRAILGLSFGGLNALYFGLHGYTTFGHIGVQSPAPHPCPNIYDDFLAAPKLPINIFLSTGTKNDKAYETRLLKKVFDQKGYDLTYKEVEAGHDWQNWKPMFSDILICFFGLQ